MKKTTSRIATVLIFITCLCVGFWIARHKGLWNDEFYTQIASVHNTSYSDQFLGHIPEGGNAPLFYALQKLFLQSIHYQTPSQWLQGHWDFDASSQILLRITSVIFMSLSVSLVFYYFCRRYSIWAGFYSLFIYLPFHMLWAYWAQARPYALLVFLTTVQSVIFLKMIDQDTRNGRDKLWMMLAGTNVLLSLTSIMSLGEILAVSALCWALVGRQWKKFIFVTLLPLMIVLFYYIHAPKYSFFFGLSRPENFFYDNISIKYFYIFYIFFISLMFYFWGAKNKILKNMLSEKILQSVPYLVFMVLVLASSAVVIWLFSLQSKPGQGFPVTSRYFIYLTPIGVIATTFLTVSLLKSSKYRLLQGIVIVLIGLLLVPHFQKSVTKEIHAVMEG